MIQRETQIRVSPHSVQKYSHEAHQTHPFQSRVLVVHPPLDAPIDGLAR